MTLAYKFLDSPLGRIKLIADEKALVAILWPSERPNRVRVPELLLSEQHPVLLVAEQQLQEYFDGRRQAFSVPVEMRGTQFQRDVWQALLDIPFGETGTYAGVARQLGKPRAVRAVGAAIGRNPLCIVFPCHRVIGTSGKLTGFAGGLDAKRFLLELEHR
jgi:methylated-DNA-[protein]-cysteine S-methyltransferase